MKIHAVEITVTQLQQALRDFCEKHAASQPEIVYVNNGFDKLVLTIPLTGGAVISGESFQRQTEID